MTRVLVVATWLLSFTGTAHAQEASPVALDALAGRWTLHDAAGTRVGESIVEVQAPGVMLFEKRTVGDRRPQPLWFSKFEADGWQQLFVGVGGGMRAFVTQSAPGAWPLVLGATVVTRDGRPTRFRMTMYRPSATDSRRVLESSSDDGATWTTVFDYHYRRTAS